MDIKKPKSAHHPSSSFHHSTQKSTTLNRKFVRKPSGARVIKSSEKTTADDARRAALAAEMNRSHLLAIKQKNSATPILPVRPLAKRAVSPISRPTPHPLQATATARQTAAKTAPRPLTARELKDRAIQRALAQVENLNPKQATIVEQQMTEIITPKKHFWRRKKFVVALSLSVVSVAFLGFLVYQNLPEIISRVTAASSGIEASEPAFLPKEYQRQSVESEKSGKITLSYSHIKNGDSFTITQEKSSWNSAALLSNYVKPTWKDNYSTAHEQGLTIYISNGNAAWVNGGVFYLIESEGTPLSPIDLHDIAVSI